LIFGLVFASRDFEVGTNVRCKVSTVSPRTELIFSFSALIDQYHWLGGRKNIRTMKRTVPFICKGFSLKQLEKDNWWGKMAPVRTSCSYSYLLTYLFTVLLVW